MHGFQKLPRVVDRQKKTDFFILTTFLAPAIFQSMSSEKLGQKVAGAKKVVKIKNQFFHGVQPREGIFEIRSHWCCIFTIFGPSFT